MEPDIHEASSGIKVPVPFLLQIFKINSVEFLQNFIWENSRGSWTCNSELIPFCK